MEQANWLPSAYGQGILISRGLEFDTYKLPDGHIFIINNDGSYTKQDEELRKICATHGIVLDS